MEYMSARKLLIITAILSLILSTQIACNGGSGMSTSTSGLGTTNVAGNGSGSNSQSTSTGSVALLGGDAPVCNVESLMLTITNATLTPVTPAGGTAGSPVTVITSANPVTVDFARLMDFMTELNLAGSVPAGTYNQITLTLTNPQITVLDMTQNPPAAVNVPATLTTPTVTVVINPPITVTANQAVGLGVDFDLRKSLAVDANGQITGQINPVFDVASSSAGTDNQGDVGDLTGMVQSVSTTSSNSAYTGSFVMQNVLGMSRTIEVNAQTQFDDGSLSGIQPNTFVEVEGFVDNSGNLVAQSVEVEEQEDEGMGRIPMPGKVVTVTRDSSGNVTQFTLFVRRGEMDPLANMPTNLATVNVTNQTNFKITAKGWNEGQLPFNAQTLGVAEEVVVHSGEKMESSPFTVNAKTIFLRPRTIVCTFDNTISVGSDGKSGAFNITPCGPLFQGQQVAVATFSDTAYVNTTGLPALNNQTPIAIRGLLFYELQPVNVNGINLPTPGWVFEAHKVHQLPQ